MLRLGSFFAALGGGGGTFAGVLTLLSDFDSTVDSEGSLGDTASLILLFGLGAGLGNLSLVGDGLLVWDNDLLGTDLGRGSSELSGKSSDTTSAWDSGTSAEGCSVSLTGSVNGLAIISTGVWGTRDSLSSTQKDDNSERFHYKYNQPQGNKVFYMRAATHYGNYLFALIYSL